MSEREAEGPGAWEIGSVGDRETGQEAGSWQRTLSTMRRALGLSGDRQLAANVKLQRRRGAGARGEAGQSAKRLAQSGWKTRRQLAASAKRYVMRRALGVAGDRQLAADTKRQRRETNRRRGPWRQRSSIRAACPREAARAASRVTRGAARASASARYAASYAVTVCRSSQILGSSTSCG